MDSSGENVNLLWGNRKALKNSKVLFDPQRAGQNCRKFRLVSDGLRGRDKTKQPTFV